MRIILYPIVALSVSLASAQSAKERLTLYEPKLSEWFSKLNTTTSGSAVQDLDSLGFTYFVAESGTGTTQYSVQTKSYFSGTCYPPNAPPFTASPQALWRIGSVSKVLAQVALFQLVDRGLVNTTDPVSKYLTQPGIASFLNGVGKKLTIEDLLQHTTGMDEGFLGTTRWDLNAVSCVDASQMLKTGFVDEPGNNIMYSNLGVTLLGAIVETVTNKLYDDVVNNDVIMPVLTEQGVASRPGDGAQPLPGFPADLKRRKDIRLICSSRNSVVGEPILQVSAPAGGYVMTSEDLVRCDKPESTTDDFNVFLQAQARFMAGLVMNSTAIFKNPATFEQSKQWPPNRRHYERGVARLYEMDEYKGVKIYTKGGDVPNFHTLAWYIPQFKEGGALIASGGVIDRARVMKDLIEALHGDNLTRALPAGTNPSTGLPAWWTGVTFKPAPADSSVAPAVRSIEGAYRGTRRIEKGLLKGLSSVVGLVSSLSLTVVNNSTIATSDGTEFVRVQNTDLAPNELLFQQVLPTEFIANKTIDTQPQLLTITFSSKVTDSSAHVVKIGIAAAGLIGLEMFDRADAHGFDSFTAILTLWAAEALAIAANKKALEQSEIPLTLLNEPEGVQKETGKQQSFTVRALRLALAILSVLAAASGLIFLALFAYSAYQGLFNRNNFVSVEFVPAQVAQVTFAWLFTVFGELQVVVAVVTLSLPRRLRGNLSTAWAVWMVLFQLLLLAGTAQMFNSNLLSYNIW
ncbi:beta-lactamase/transpeptidase-like protein [Cladochytrium replicatum]|nr:beta-lactamase/transpeptidase-like protein [Cladochytrium replicatum]